jgi:hypothetical protein
VTWAIDPIKKRLTSGKHKNKGNPKKKNIKKKSYKRLTMKKKKSLITNDLKVE